jgi:hypothetical protein
MPIANRSGGIHRNLLVGLGLRQRCSPPPFPTWIGFRGRIAFGLTVLTMAYRPHPHLNPP